MPLARPAPHRSRDARRSARLLFGPELESGSLADADLDHPEVQAAVRTAAIPSAPVRLSHRLALRRGRLSYEGTVTDPMVRARRELLGAEAAGPPRVLVRVDEYPHWRAWQEPEVSDEAYLRFHEIMRAAGVPYLIAVVPRTSLRPDDPEDDVTRPLQDHQREMLERLRTQDVAFALHGLDHRTRYTSARRYTELGGLADGPLGHRLDAGVDILTQLDLEPSVLVPPFNTFDASSWSTLAARFAVITGGPESVRTMGFQPTPTWRGDAVFLPSYAPLYAAAEAVRPAVERLRDAEAALWVPVVLHWGWERERGWRDLERLAEVLGQDGLARPWAEFLDAVATSRDAA